MFGLLKQKLSGFLDKLTKKEDEKPASEANVDEKAIGEEKRKAEEEKERKDAEEKSARDEEVKKKEEAKRKGEEEEEKKKLAEEEKKKQEEEKRKADEARKKEEEKREEEKRKTLAEKKKLEEERRKAEEGAKAAKKAEEDARKAAEEMKKREAAAKEAAESASKKEREAKADHDSKAKKKAEEEMHRAQEDAKKAHEEKKRLEEHAAKLAHEAKAKAEEIKRKAEEEARLAKKIAEEERRAEEERKAAQKKAEEEKKEEEKAKKKLEEEKQKIESEKKKSGFFDNIPFFGKKAEVMAQEAPASSRQTAETAHAKAHEAPQAKADTYDMERLSRKAESGERKMEVRMGVAKTIGSIFKSEIEITEEDVRDLIDELELAMLEADVAYDVSVGISSELRQKLVGMRVPKGALNDSIRIAMAGVLASSLRSGREFDFMAKIKALEKPVKILFIGPNGAGKTTTMAKVGKRLMDEGMTCVISASDTFRAAAIEQAEVHGKRLGIEVIKSKYGSDPAAVAFDAIAHARSNKLDVVLIDSSGRQDTNANLLDELKKMVRVSKPDLKIYIGESIGGNAVVDQIKAFHESVGLDGAILTKLDCDAKGGTALSVARATGVPVLFIGTGQGYGDLEPFDADKLANDLVAPSSAS